MPCVINSELVKKNATAEDPWGLEYTKQNTAGSGAYKVTKWTPGTEVVLERNEDWKLGTQPKVKRIIWRIVPSAGNRRALLERGDADISYELPNKDFVELREAGKLNIVSTPFSNGVAIPRHERDQATVRQHQGAPGRRVCCSLSEDHGCGSVRPGQAPVWRPGTGERGGFGRRPQANTDIAKAKQLMAEAGYPNGFETTLSFDLGFATINEPLCCADPGEPGPDRHQGRDQQGARRDWRTELNKKVMPLYTNVFSGWLDYPEYFFIWCYSGKNSIFNTMSYVSKDMDAFIDGAGAAATSGDTAAYEKNVKGFVDLAFTDIPRIPLYQPYSNVAMQKNVSGYQYRFHRRLDYRALVKA